MAQTPISASKLFFFCKVAHEQGGATRLCRSDMLLAEFACQQPEWTEQFRVKWLKYTTQMPAENNINSGQGRSWKNPLTVDNR